MNKTNDNQQKNHFISIEGIEGVGKSTIVNFLIKILQHNSCDFIKTREPGGTEIAEKIRTLLLTHHLERMCQDTELLLMFAGRAQNIQSVILPALVAGKWVLSDRFTDASFAYQGGGRGLSVVRISELAHWVQGELWPNLTLLLDAPVEVAMTRVQSRGAKDRIEQEGLAFFERARLAYLDLANKHPDRFVIVDASQAQKKVCDDIATIMQQKYGFNVSI